MSATLARNVWWCNQSKCHNVERAGSCIAGSATGTRLKYRRLVEEARPGDVVVHYRSGAGIDAVSSVLTVPQFASVPFAGTARCWPAGEQAWFCEADYVVLKDAIPKLVFLRNPAALRNDDGPLVKGDKIRRAYFMRFTPEGLATLRALATGNWPSWA